MLDRSAERGNEMAKRVRIQVKVKYTDNEHPVTINLTSEAAVASVERSVAERGGEILQVKR